MKKINIVLAIAVTILAGVLSACSDEPAPLAKTDPANFVKNGEVVQGTIDINTLSRFASDLKDATYTLEEYAMYQMDDYSNGLWEVRDLHDLAGWSLPMSNKIIVKDGMCWEPIRMFSSASGWTSFRIALDLIERVQQKDYRAYVRRPIVADIENQTISIGLMKYGILHADADMLALSYECSYDGGRTHNGGLEMWVATYSLSDPLEFSDTTMAFDSETAAYDWLIGVFSDMFGDSVNRNDYYNGTIILDNPIFYLSSLIEERDRLGGR